MKVVLTESQFEKIFLSEIAQNIQNNVYNPTADGNSNHNPYTRKIDRGLKRLLSFLRNNGRIMTNIDNGKDYIIYEISSFANLMGVRFVICQLVREDGPYGSIYVKPFELFRIKT